MTLVTKRTYEAILVAQMSHDERRYPLLTSLDSLTKFLEEWDYDDVAEWIQNNREAYLQGLLYGFKEYSCEDE